MSELHTYRIRFPKDSHGTGEICIQAFTAADAVAQWHCRDDCESRRVFGVEPLHDAPEPRPSEKQREWLRVLDETTGTIPGLTVEAWRLHELERRLAKLEGAPENVHAPEELRPKWVGVNLTPLEQTARAATPADRIGAIERTAELEKLRASNDARGAALRDIARLLRPDWGGYEPRMPEELVEAARKIEATLVERTAQRDNARQAAQDHFEDVRALVDAIEGRPDPGNHIGPDLAARMARETREERDRLRAERDALACAAVGQDPRMGVSMVDVERVARDLNDLHARDKNRRATLNEIAAIVWPHVQPGPPVYALEDLVAEVRKMVAERADLCAQVERQVIALRDGQRDKADLRANIQSVGEECDALQKALDHLRYAAGAHGTEDNGWVAKQIERYKAGYEELPVERDKLRNVTSDRDAIQKRIDAAEGAMCNRDYNRALEILRGRGGEP